MSNFFILLKANILNNLGINKLLSKQRKKTKIVLASVGIAFLFLFLFAVAIIYMIGIATMLDESGAADNVILIGIVGGAFLTIISTITKGNAYLFKTKDFDLLMSMPIKPSAVVASKIGSLVIFNMLTFIMIYVPSLIAYAIFVPTDIIFWLYALIIFFVTPLLPVAVCTFISYFISIITSKMKFKNLISTVLLLGLFIGVMVVNMNVSSNPDQATDMILGLMNRLKNMYYPGYLGFQGLQGNHIDMLLYVFMNLASFALFIFIIGKLYFKLTLNYDQSTKTVSQKFDVTTLEKTQTKGILSTLFRKELKRYFGAPMYVLNTIISPLLVPLMIIIMSTGVLSEGEGILSADIATLLFSAIAVFMIGISTPTASSISLEGKQLWILKTSPIDTKQIFIAKLLLPVVISVPFLIIATGAMIYFYQITIIQALLFFILPLLQVSLMGLYGLYINILIPKLDWIQEIKVIKQSMSVTITVFTSIFFDIIIIGLSVLVFTLVGNVLLTLLFGFFIILLLCIGMSAILFTHGKKKFERITA